MLDRALSLIATIAVWTIGAKRCGRAVARHYCGEQGTFMVGFHAEIDEDEDDDDGDEPAAAGLDPDIWGGWAKL